MKLALKIDVDTWRGPPQRVARQVEKHPPPPPPWGVQF